MNGTRLSAVLGQDTIGFIEVETVDEGERRSRHGGWADVGNVQVAEACRRQGVATWLLGQAGWPAGRRTIPCAKEATRWTARTR